ncbi:MAG: fibronectin type III domain-containing protein [Bacteroidales bacterium]|nr:fibronectin type III domain-containing protein [Bacteroidales bacterium]
MKKFLLFLMFALFCIPWAANAQETLLVHDGTTTNQYVPFYGYYADEDQQNQMIYPATELTDMAGAEITQMVFHYSSLGSGGTGVGTWTVSLGETRNTTLSGLDNSTTLTEVFTGGLDALFNTTDQTLTITFDNGYTYQGGNLLVEFSHEASGWKQCYFYGETVTGASYCYNAQRNFLPKTTFTYEPASNCAKPTDLAVNYTSGATNATVTWSGDARSYNIDVNGTVTNDVTSPYTLGNLTPNTTYTIKVQSDCGDEQSAWALAGSFTTPCEAYAIPYAYGFEDANDITCWSMVNIPSDATDFTGVQTNAWAESNLGGDYARSGNNFFFFLYYAYSTQGVPFQTLISPELSGISNGLHVEFYYSGYSNGIETFKVGYSTTDNDPDSFIWGNEITASSSYQRFSANYPAGTKYVAVQHTSDDQYYLFLDDFLFEESASCLEPSGVQVADVTTTGATISWTAGGEETAWDIFVTDDATVEPDETTTPTVAGTEANPYSLTDLDPATIYYVYVRAICGEDEVSAWSSPAIFNTECNAMALPYNYGFEDAALPVCWNTIIENTSYTGINLMAPSTSSTNQVLAFYMGTYQNPALVAVLPEVDEDYPLNRYQITFDACYANSGSSSMTAGKLGIGIMTDPTDFTTFELIEEVDITDGFSTFGTHNVWFNSYTGNGRYIAIRDIYTQSGYVLVDNIEVTELPACLQPTNLTVEGGKNAVVTWEGDAESFDIAYSDDNTVDPADNIVDNTTENTFNLGEAVDLTEGDYYVWVRANCGTDGYSEWTAPVSFHVGYCTPNPTSHDGKGITGVSFGMGDYVVTNGDGSASVPASSPYYGDYTSLIGAVQAGVESTIAITTGTNSYPYTFVIWVDLDNSMSFEDNDILYIGKASAGNGTLNATITIPATQATGDYRMRIYGADSYFTSFYGSGTTNWDADHDPCSSGSYRHAHDYTLRVLEAPSCLAAGDVTVAPENITSTSAVITWTNNNGEEATYTVMQGETVLTTTAVDSYTLTLTPSTSYPAGTFTIISDCDENAIANVPAFSTLCDDITALPWSEDFESFASNTVPNCWDNSASTSSISNSSSSPNCIWGVVTVSGNNMIKMENYWASSGTALINTPTIVLPAEGAYQLAFDYAHNADCGAFAVKVSTDNGTTFTELASYTKGSGTSHEAPGDFTPATISLADYAGESIILQFFANATYGNGAIFVDNVAVTEIAPACELALDAVESFETYTTSTELWTGAFPDCWTIAHNYTTLSSDSVAMIYRSFKTHGYYSLRLHYRGIVAMPALPSDVDINHVKLNMNVRQSQSFYALQVGVMTDLDDESTFVPVALCNNPTTGKLPFECNFADYVAPEGYEGPFYIAFKNIGVAETDPHSVNYLDEVVVTTFEEEEVPACAITELEYTEFFNELSIADDGRLVPECWTLPEEFNSIPTNNKPQLYNSFAHTGSYSLKMRDFCVYAMPKYAVPGTPITDVKMTFWLRQAHKAYQLEVGVMTDANDASTFIPVQLIDNETTGKEEVTVSFANYTGSVEGDLYIAFRNKGQTSSWTYSYNYIDDITLVDVTAEGGSKISETADGEVFDTDRYLDNIVVYPNPTTGNLYIDAVDVQKVECYNQMGQLVGVYDNANELNISELSNGVYMLRITVPQGVTMRKVVKR